VAPPGNTQSGQQLVVKYVTKRTVPQVVHQSRQGGHGDILSCQAQRNALKRTETGSGGPSEVSRAEAVLESIMGGAGD